ncbi:hypothetical protein A0H81_01102 [Grifola frondosa]|uniref:Uncharacterized protein n=1 Tax=Grifola frondosa TaxID=5627 RepID=A0A1C7MR92_GRIFR|nr:hypothetical protein A0H81_01102 [Grifola frondosa]
MSISTLTTDELFATNNAVDELGVDHSAYDTPVSMKQDEGDNTTVEMAATALNASLSDVTPVPSEHQQPVRQLWRPKGHSQSPSLNKGDGKTKPKVSDPAPTPPAADAVPDPDVAASSSTQTPQAG